MVVTDTATQLLDTAQQLVQQRGFNAFSYKDLAEAVGIRTASIHYHFETKARLGEALMQRYLRELRERLQRAEKGNAKARLRSYIKIYHEANDNGHVCLCGSLASDIETLPDEVRKLVDTYLSNSEEWVAEQITRGAKAGEFEPIASPRDLATLLVNGLQGALLLGRARPDRRRLARVERTFWKALNP